jgi:hypothetical protein
VALWRGQGERLRQGGQRGRLVAAGVQGECLQRPDLDDAAGPSSPMPTQQLQPLRLHLVAIGVIVWCAGEGVILLDQRQQLLA